MITIKPPEQLAEEIVKACDENRNRPTTLQQDKKEIADLLRENNQAIVEALKEVKQSIKPFQSGIDVLPWGKIKALIGVELAKRLTHHNIGADTAVEQLASLITTLSERKD